MAQNKPFDSIKTNRLFQKVDEKDIKLSISAKDFIPVKEGEIIFQTGDNADMIFLLIDGEVKIKHVQAIDGQRIFEKGKDDFFGEPEFLTQTVRNSSAVANKPCTLYLLKRKELNNLMSGNRTILNNLQRIDSAKDELDEYHTTKERYSPEISDLLKTSEQTRDPYGYTPAQPENLGNVSAVNQTEGTPAEEEPAKSGSINIQTQENDFPKQFNKTFEDSFTFGDDSKFSFQNVPDAEVEKNPEHEEVENLSWDFASMEIPEDETIPEPQAEKIIETVKAEEIIPPVEESHTQEFTGINWNFERELEPETTEELPEIIHDAPVSAFDAKGIQEATEKPEEEIPKVEEEKFAWNFFNTHEEEVKVDEPKSPDIPEWFNETGQDDEPIKEFEFDEHGNLIASKPDSEYKIPEQDRDADFSTEFKDENLVFENPVEEEEKQWGKKDFLFTAPLEAKTSAPKAPVIFPQSSLSSEQLHLIINAAKLVNSNIKLDEILNVIVQAASSITNADRGTLYIVDQTAGELWSKVIRGDDIEEIRLKIGQGLAGWVAQTGETVNIEDVSTDTRFDPDIDKHTGYKTKSMLCFPIKNKEEQIIAVIQLLNNQFGLFKKIDEDFLEALSAHIAIALENAELVAQLLNTDRLTSLGKVAKFLIADIKKPILTIKQLADHIKKKNVSPEVNQVLSILIEQSNIVVDLVLTTLNYSEGRTVLNKKPLSLHRVLDELLDLLAEYVEYRKVNLYKKFGTDVLVNVDRRELYQAFFQITKNACDAMPQGGDLYVNVIRHEDKIHISFKDSGVGIPDSIKDKIFEPFMSYGKKNEVGLGLPITEKIIKEHDGSIIIDSKVGVGTTVTLVLPIVQ